VVTRDLASVCWTPEHQYQEIPHGKSSTLWTRQPKSYVKKHTHEQGYGYCWTYWLKLQVEKIQIVKNI